MAEWALTKCPHCKGIVDIKNSTYVSKLVTQLKTLREEYSLAIKNNHKIHTCKNGVIQSLHKKIGLIIKLMDENQIEEFKKINKSCRDELKHWKRKFLE